MNSHATKMFFAALLMGTGLAHANSTYVLEIQQPATSVQIPFQQAGVPSGAFGVSIANAPQYFEPPTLNPSGDEWVLVPTVDFWTAGTDRMIVTWTGPTTGSATVFLAAARAKAETTYDFEETYPLDPSNFGTAVSIGSDGAILGTAGLAIDGGGGTGYGQVDLPLSHGTGGQSSSGQTHVLIEDPDDTNPQTWHDINEHVTILALYNTSDYVIAEAQIAARQLGPEIRLVVPGMPEGSWHGFEYDTAKIVQLDSFGGNSALIVDGLVIDMKESATTPGIPYAYRFGNISGSSAVAFRIRLDNIEMGSDGAGDGVWQLSSEDDFNPSIGPTDDPIVWNHTSQAAGSVSTSYSGELEIAITNNTAWSSHLRDSSPVQAKRYSVGFDVDTSLLQMGPGEQMHMLIGYPGDPVANNHLQVRLSPSGSDFKIRADAKDDQGIIRDLGWHTVDRGKHRVEVQWRAATEDGVNDGHVRLFIDGAYMGSVTGIDNDNGLIEAIRLGVFSIDSGTSGILAYDNFVSWTERP